MTGNSTIMAESIDAPDGLVRAVVRHEPIPDSHSFRVVIDYYGQESDEPYESRPFEDLAEFFVEGLGGYQFLCEDKGQEPNLDFEGLPGKIRSAIKGSFGVNINETGSLDLTDIKFEYDELWGVVHNSEEELERVKKRIDERNPKRVGLEIVQDVLDQRIYSGYFGELTRYLVEKGIEVIPLEDTDLADKRNAILLAADVLDGRRTREEIKEALDDTGIRLSMANIFCTEPRRISTLHFRKKYYEGTLELLDRNPTRYILESRWTELNAKRRTYMLTKINAELPDVAIIGVGLADPINGKLPNHQYTKFGEIETKRLFQDEKS